MLSIDTEPIFGGAFRVGSLLAAFLFFFAGSAQTQDRGATAGNTPTASVTGEVPAGRAGVRVGEIQIDGRIDEDAWQAAPVLSNFVQREPLEGQPAEEETHVRILFDDEAIYIGARMFEADTSRIRALLVPRGQGGMFQDWINISFDTNLDGRTAYQFQLNAAGAQRDSYRYEDDRQDLTWYAVWESAVTRDSLGWTAEIRVPLSQIRYRSSGQPQTWGIQLMRSRAVASEVSQFALQGQEVSGIVSQYGRLEGVLVPSTARRVEMRPYFLSSFLKGPKVEGDPFFDGTSVDLSAGSDFRLGLGSAFTLDATINPDFGQVEADPTEVNLTAFESVFDERRPFFIEDAQIFEFELSGQRNQLFYSRRIGRSPQIRESVGVNFVDVAESATIAAAGKLTGRTAAGLSVGALGAMTRAEIGRAYSLEDGEARRYLAEPRTGYGVLTAQQDWNEGASRVRVITSMLKRDLPADSDLSLIREAYTGCADTVFTFYEPRCVKFSVVGHTDPGRGVSAPPLM